MFAIARFVMRGGTMHNAYMAYGGTSFGRTVGGPQIVTSYDYDVAINEYGLPNPSKFPQMAALHAWLAHAAPFVLAANEIPPMQILGFEQQGYAYLDASDAGVVFLANLANQDATVSFPVAGAPTNFTLPRWSASLMDAQSGKVLFNTATGPFVSPPSQRRRRLGNGGLDQRPAPEDKLVQKSRVGAGSPAAVAHNSDAHFDLHYLCLPDVFGVGTNASRILSSTGPLPQIATTQDRSDYLFYAFNTSLTADDLSAGFVDLNLTNVGDYMVFRMLQVESVSADLVLQTGMDVAALRFDLTKGGPWLPAPVEVLVMSQTMGLKNYAAHLESRCEPTAERADQVCNAHSLSNCLFRHRVRLHSQLQRGVGWRQCARRSVAAGGRSGGRAV